MSAATRCPACNNELAAEMAFCGWCGASLTGSQTSPVNVHEAKRRLFGVPPAPALLLLGVAALLIGASLLVTDRLVAGLLLTVGGALLLAIFPGIARRPGETGIARGAVRSYDGLRERAGASVDALTARLSAQRELVGLGEEVAELRRSRTELLDRLGAAAYVRDEPEIERLRGEIASVDEDLEAKRRQAEQVQHATEKRISAARLRAQPTQRLRGEDVRAKLSAESDGEGPHSS